MKRIGTTSSCTGQLGFSLIELLVSILILSVIMGAVFREIATVMQRSSAEATKLDLIQESREFVDQMSRDLHQAGYPNSKNFAVNPPLGVNDSSAAVGLVKVAADELIFEGDVDGTGTVSSVRYHIETSGPSCPCIKRSQTTKLSADPLTGQAFPAYEIEMQDVLNGTTSAPIFYAYTTNNVAVTLPVDFATPAGRNTLAGISTIKAVLTVQARTPDPKTGQRPITTLVSTVKLENCSSAAQSQVMSCQ